jgi:metal-dependent amidase/aminoacylase/carboxypeptidase family protein
MSAQQEQNVLSHLGMLLPELESVYKDIHSHPELSMQENRTAGIAAERLRAAGYEVTTGVGKTGVVGVLHNSDGGFIMTTQRTMKPPPSMPLR